MEVEGSLRGDDNGRDLHWVTRSWMSLAAWAVIRVVLLASRFLFFLSGFSAPTTRGEGGRWECEHLRRKIHPLGRLRLSSAGGIINGVIRILQDDDGWSASTAARNLRTVCLESDKRQKQAKIPRWGWARGNLPSGRPATTTGFTQPGRWAIAQALHVNFSTGVWDLPLGSLRDLGWGGRIASDVDHGQRAGLRVE